MITVRKYVFCFDKLFMKKSRLLMNTFSNSQKEKKYVFDIYQCGWDKSRHTFTAVTSESDNDKAKYLARKMCPFWHWSFLFPTHRIILFHCALCREESTGSCQSLFLRIRRKDKHPCLIFSPASRSTLMNRLQTCDSPAARK